MPYQTGIKVTGWVPKLNGELRIDFQIDVKNKVQVGMLLGEKGRILKEVRERAAQILIEKLQRPVVLTVDVTIRRNRIDIQN
jgi:GTPase Era involved in 16S rRNA processing